MIQHTLTGPWQVHALPIDAAPSRRSLADPAADPERAALAAPGIDVSGWETVPAAAHLQLHFYPDRPYWGDHLRALNENVWVYRRTIPAAAVPEAARCRLRFDAVDYYAEVWLNGAFVGRHEGGFAPFTFDVTEQVALAAPGEDNTLAVFVAAPWDPPSGGSSPVDRVRRGMVKGLYEHAEGLIPPNVNPIGIWGAVHLIGDRGASIEDFNITTKIDGAVTVRATVENTGVSVEALTLVLQIHGDDPDVPVTAALIGPIDARRETVTHTFHLKDPRLWWPWDQGEPYCYTLEAALFDHDEEAEDAEPLAQHAELFGVREVRLERTHERFVYHINGRRVYVRGTAYMPDLYLSRVTEATLARDFDLMQAAGLNLARVHVHVSPKALYEMADRRGMLIWQDFELNWLHDYSEDFERRAVALQRDMFRHLYNHPSIVTWCCYNEPTMLIVDRENLLLRPCPALYADALAQDPTRPVFICSGQLERDIERAGDVHTYYGAIWSKRYTDVYRHPARLNSEFGFEAPADPRTLRAWPDLWERTRHLVKRVDALWDYQFELTRYHVEHFRRHRFAPNAGYMHFFLSDLAPGVGCGALDALRRPKGGYDALKLASQPVHFFMEHDGRRPVALWAVNDTPADMEELVAGWHVEDAAGEALEAGEIRVNLPAGSLVKVCDADWRLGKRAKGCMVTLTLAGVSSETLVRNVYARPFEARPRPPGYPWNYDPYLGVKVFDQPGARSIVAPVNHRLLRPFAPLAHAVAEWALRQELPPRLANRVSQVIEWVRRRQVLSDR
jgi:beta-mannosidase